MRIIKTTRYISKSLDIDVTRATWNNLTGTHDGPNKYRTKIPPTFPCSLHVWKGAARLHVCASPIIYVAAGRAVRVCVLEIQWGRQQYLTQSEIPLFMDL